MHAGTPLLLLLPCSAVRLQPKQLLSQACCAAAAAQMLLEGPPTVCPQSESVPATVAADAALNLASTSHCLPPRHRLALALSACLPACSPVRMMSRNGSRGTGKVDSASSLEQGGDGAHPPHQHPPHHHQAAAAMQHQMGKMTLAE